VSPHLDPERIALIALGEPVEPAERAHLDKCGTCAAEAAELESAVAVGRASLDVGALETPPERVWEGVLAQTTRAAPASGPRAAPEAAESVAPDIPSPAERRVSRTRMWVTLAASVALLAGLVGLGVALRPAPYVEIAAATLDAFPAHPGASGTAVVEADGARRVVRVSVAADEPDDGHREVWLLTSDATELVSLGVLEGDGGEFAIPDDVDLARFAIVDVSLEPDDDDPAHSGDSIVRGELHRA
jgi:hypothetical protein